MLRAVLLDVGGVLTTAPHDGVAAFADATGLSPTDMRRLLGPQGAWARFEAGLVTRTTFSAEFASEVATLGGDATGDDFLETFLGVVTVRAELRPVVEDLASRYRLGCVTNMAPVEMPGLPEFLELCHVRVVSHEVHLRKPDPAIFALCTKLLAVAPADTLFVDDSELHVRVAEHLGYQVKLVEPGHFGGLPEL